MEDRTCYEALWRPKARGSRGESSEEDALREYKAKKSEDTGYHALYDNPHLQDSKEKEGDKKELLNLFKKYLETSSKTEKKSTTSYQQDEDEVKYEEDDELMRILRSNCARCAAARALAIIGNDDSKVGRSVNDEKAQAVSGSVEIAAAVLLLLWHTKIGAKQLGIRNPARSAKGLPRFPRGYTIHCLLEQNEHHGREPVKSVLACAYAILFVHAPHTEASRFGIRSDLRNFLRARVAKGEQTDLLLALRHHIISLAFTPISSIYHPLKLLYDYAAAATGNNEVSILTTSLIYILMSIAFVVVIYLYSLGPLLSILFYIKSHHWSITAKKENYWFPIFSFDWNNTETEKVSDITVVEAFGPMIILYGANWLFFTYPKLRRRYFLENDDNVCLGDNVIDHDQARDFLVEVRCAVVKFSLTNKDFDEIENGKAKKVVKRSIRTTLRQFNRQCKASYIRKTAWFRRYCIANPYRVANLHSYNSAQATSLVVTLLRTNPMVLFMALNTIGTVATLPMFVRYTCSRDIFGGASFEHRWIAITFLITTILNGYWPVLLVGMWFRKFNFISYKFEAMCGMISCNNSEVYGLDYYLPLANPLNVAALMLFRERLHRLSITELGYLPPESLLTFLMTIPLLLMANILWNLLNENTGTSEVICLFSVCVKVYDPVAITVSLSLCIFATLYAVTTLMQAAKANYQLNEAFRETLESEQNMRSRDSCLDDVVPITYNPKLRDTADVKTTMILDISMARVKSEQEFLFTMFGYRINTITIYSVVSSLAFLIMTSAIGSISSAIAKSDVIVSAEESAKH